MPDLQFSRALRLLQRNEYQQVFAEPIRSADRHLTVLARANSLQHPRLGLVIMKKHVRQAVQRNRIKRLTRESFRLHQHHLDSLDIVVLSRLGVAQLSNHRLSASLAQHWQHLNRLCDASSCC